MVVAFRKVATGIPMGALFLARMEKRMEKQGAGRGACGKPPYARRERRPERDALRYRQRGCLKVPMKESSVTFLNGPTVAILKMHIPRADYSMGIRTIR